MTETVGFIGLGVMGGGMARNILKAGYPLVVTTSSREKADAFARLGAEIADTAADVARCASLIVTCVPDAAALFETVAGADGVAAASWENGLLVDCSTIAPADAKRAAARLAKSGAGMLDAPVSGGRKGAEDGTLTIMCGGDADAFTRARPVLEAMGKAVHHVGPLGAGQALKACNQLMVAVNLMGVCEAIAIARGAGVDPHVMREVLSTGAARSGVLEMHALRYLEGALAGGFRGALMKKDLAIAVSVGAAQGRVQPATALAHQMMTGACNAGLADHDSAAIGLFYDGLNSSTPSGTDE